MHRSAGTAQGAGTTSVFTFSEAGPEKTQPPVMGVTDQQVAMKATSHFGLWTPQSLTSKPYMPDASRVLFIALNTLKSGPHTYREEQPYLVLLSSRVVVSLTPPPPLLACRPTPVNHSCFGDVSTTVCVSAVAV
jgi:hypothetical protein